MGIDTYGVHRVEWLAWWRQLRIRVLILRASGHEVLPLVCQSHVCKACKRWRMISVYKKIDLFFLHSVKKKKMVGEKRSLFQGWTILHTRAGRRKTGQIINLRIRTTYSEEIHFFFISSKIKRMDSCAPCILLLRDSDIQILIVRNKISLSMD